MSAPGGFEQRVRSLAIDAERPNGDAYKSLSATTADGLCTEFSLPLAEVQALALDFGVVPERYVRNFDAISQREQANLLRSHAMLVGLGGLGGYVLETLCRMGVGRVSAADGDTFEASNLNRQLLSTVSTVDSPKAAAAITRARAINPATQLHAEQSFWDRAAMDRIAATTDVAIDALGGLDDRLALQQAAAKAGIPLVTSAIAGNSGYVATVLPGASGPADLLGTGAAAEDALGSPAPCVATAANLMAGEAIRILHGGKPALAGRMLVFDLDDMTFEKVDISL